VPFPFEFAQMVWLMLVFFSIIPFPVLCATALSRNKAVVYTFMITFVFWAVYHMAVEIEMPFGNDANDLPLDILNDRFNKVLQTLLMSKAQQLPRMAKAPRVSVRYERVESTVMMSRVASQKGILAGLGRLLRKKPPRREQSFADNIGALPEHSLGRDAGGLGSEASQSQPDLETPLSPRPTSEAPTPTSARGSEREVSPRSPPAAAEDREQLWKSFERALPDDASQISPTGPHVVCEVARVAQSARKGPR